MSLVRTEVEHIDRTFSIVLHDGDRLLLKSRKVGIGYAVTGYGISLLDKKPHPAAANRLGVVAPNLMWIEHGGVRAVRRIFKRIEDSAGGATITKSGFWGKKG